MLIFKIKKQTIVEGTQITPIKIVPTNTGEWTKVDEEGIRPYGS